MTPPIGSYVSCVGPVPLMRRQVPRAIPVVADAGQKALLASPCDDPTNRGNSLRRTASGRRENSRNLRSRSRPRRDLPWHLPRTSLHRSSTPIGRTRTAARDWLRQPQILIRAPGHRLQELHLPDDPSQNLVWTAASGFPPHSRRVGSSVATWTAIADRPRTDPLRAELTHTPDITDLKRTSE